MQGSSLLMERRTLLGAMAAGLGTTALGAVPSQAIRAVAFDAFVIFDGRTIVAAARDALGESGAAFASAWLQKLFGDTWLLTAAERYAPFESVAASSLDSAADMAGVSLSVQVRSDLLGRFSHLGVWPDVPGALATLRAAGIRSVILSNLSESLLIANLGRSDLTGAFDAVLSTDRVRRYKPAPSAYAMAPRELGLPIANIGFAAFGGWDAAGATWFGFPTAWVNRGGGTHPRLDAKPRIVSPGIEGVLALAGLK